jgi:hypothetical protein
MNGIPSLEFINKHPILFEYDSKLRRSGDITNYTISTPIPVSGTIRLVNVCIPFTHDVIHAPCNVLTFIELGSKSEIERKIEVPEGNYDLEELCLVLEQLMSGYGGQKYKLSQNKGILRIDATDNFKLTWTSESIWEQLGFLPREYVGKTWRALLPPTLTPDGMYYLDISGLGNIAERRIMSNNVKCGTFPLLLKGSCYEIAEWKNTTMSPVSVRLGCSQINVRLFDSRGNLVNLKKDWSFVLENMP